MAKDERSGRRLRELRERTGLSQTQVADQIGISRAYLSGLEGGHATPGIQTLSKLARLYGVSLDALHHDPWEGGPRPPPDTRPEWTPPVPPPPARTAGRTPLPALPSAPQTVAEGDKTVPPLLDLWRQLPAGQKFKLLVEMQAFIDAAQGEAGPKPADPDQTQN